MNRSKWWNQKYYDHIANIGILPTITKLEVSLHYEDIDLLDNDNDILIDTFLTEISFSDYLRQEVILNASSKSSDMYLKWGSSEEDWIDIQTIGIIGTCIYKAKTYKKCLWFKNLDMLITKDSNSKLIIPKGSLFFS